MHVQGSPTIISGQLWGTCVRRMLCSTALRRWSASSLLAVGSPTVRVIPRARRWGGQETDLSHLFAGGAAHLEEPQNSKLKAVAAVLPRVRCAARDA